MKKFLLAVMTALLLGTPAMAQSHLSNSLYKEGVRLGNEGKVKEAVGRFQKAAILEPGVFLYQLKLAYAYEMLKRYPEAQAAYENAIKAKRRSPEAHRGLADVLRRAGFYKPAEKEYKKALRYRRKYKEALMGLAILYADTKDLDAAAATYLKVFKLFPKNRDAAFKAANVFWQQKKLDDAIKYYRKALALDDGFDKARFGLGLALRDKGDIEGARTELKKACEHGVKQACKRLFQL
ncbi:MAG: tetratricopeptide repeat protein [Deltaproteobacteria bacterium]|nr:tetratricopeptide repeat protein [Deltaproteobacteria bacterium]